MLGLPAYKWLSPELAQDHTDDLLKMGGRKLGTKPADTAKRLRVPPNRQIAVPRPYLSAREAFDLIRPFMAQFKPPWNLTHLSSHGVLEPDGYGCWQTMWRYGESGDTIQASLCKGRLYFRGDSAPEHMASYLQPGVHLPEMWLDSPEIAGFVANLPRPDGLVGPTLGLLSLRSFKNAPCLWEAKFVAGRNAGGTFKTWDVYLDPVTGDVFGEGLGWRRGSMIVPARYRISGGDWQDLPSPE